MTTRSCLVGALSRHPKVAVPGGYTSTEKWRYEQTWSRQRTAWLTS